MGGSQHHDEMCAVMPKYLVLFDQGDIQARLTTFLSSVRDGGFQLNEPALKMLACCSACKIFDINMAHLAPKGAIYGQGFYRKCQPDGQKGAISGKEIAIFEPRKVLFPDKHLRELPGACKNMRWRS
jgi:hypothetical protein